MVKLIISNGLIFTFAKLRISNALMVRKEKLFTKITKAQKNLIRNKQLKSRSF